MLLSFILMKMLWNNYYQRVSVDQKFLLSHQCQNLFIDLGADPSLADLDGNNALHLSTILMNRSNQSNILFHLVTQHSNLLCETNKLGLIPLHIALMNFDYHCINYLMPEEEGKLREEAQHSLFTHDSIGRHALHYAAHSGLTSFIERYFQQMPKNVINEQDSFGLTPLHYAW